MTRESADLIGLQAVAWLAANDELLPVFMGATGASEAEFRSGLGDRDFQAGVLDFLLMDDAWVLAFCAAQQIEGTALVAARAHFPGGGEVHWT